MRCLSLCLSQASQGRTVLIFNSKQSAAGLAIWLLIQTRGDEHHLLRVTQLDGTCTWGSRLRCAQTAPFRAGFVLFALGGVVYCALYAWYIVRTFAQLKQRLYQDYRVANQLLQVQVCAPAELCVYGTSATRVCACCVSRK